MVDINKSNPTSFKLHFPLIPNVSTISEQRNFTVHIIDTILPAITINSLTYPFRGQDLYGEGGGIEFETWTTNFYIDENWNSYLLLYEWMIGIYNGITNFGRKDFSYQINGILTILDNYENPLIDFNFYNIWPSSLGSVKLSYQDGENFLSGSVTFKYDYFLKKD